MATIILACNIKVLGKNKAKTKSKKYLDVILYTISFCVFLVIK